MIQTVTVPPAVESVAVVDPVLDAQARAAARNRDLLGRHGITALEFIGPIVAGKTSLITRIVERLQSSRRVAVVNGDPWAADDLVPMEAPVVPIVRTGAYGGRLDALHVSRALARLPLARLELVLIENVRSLSCPGESALGAHARIVILSAFDGPSVVREHPEMIRGASLVAINKADLAGVKVGDLAALAGAVRQVRPDLPVIFTSACTGEGLADLASAVNAF